MFYYGFGVSEFIYVFNPSIDILEIFVKFFDLLMGIEDSEVGFIELENGYIITETIMSPHGTGMAGLNYYESLESFEESCGTDYKRIKNKSHQQGV